jgi:hypothetical protein
MLLSDNCTLSSDIKDIETYLEQNYGSIIRWAIVDVTDNMYKISFTYEQKKIRD